MMRTRGNRVVKTGRAQLALLAIVWKHPRVSELEIALNHTLRATLARWIPPRNVLEISATAKSRGGRALREIISHEAAHVVVWDRFGRTARPHGPEWAALVRAAGFEARATLVRCGQRRAGRGDGIRIRHFCPTCHFSRVAKRRVTRWRCPECRAIGLDGALAAERISGQ
jgi:predicted SprT family Zn-dependent metalloprotease